MDEPQRALLVMPLAKFGSRLIRRTRRWLTTSVTGEPFQIRSARPPIGYHRCRMKPTLAPHVLFGTLVLFGSAIAFAQESTPQNLPYVAVHKPEFIPAPAATFMNADDRVIGLMSGKTAKAYPAGILAQHGLVQDDSPSGPIAVTW